MNNINEWLKYETGENLFNNPPSSPTPHQNKSFWPPSKDFSKIFNPPKLEGVHAMDLWYLNNMKVISTLWTLHYFVCVPFSCIDSFHIYQISEINDQTFINLTLINVFDFIG